ncbi:MAG: hypothetical protein H0X66_08250 [Verrucomicrobia bacterium]|nr:hypothetical protein [Verrucomicrobiota bacterium]
MAVILIMTVLSAILLPALNKGRTRSQAISCLNNLRQLQLSWQMFPDDNSGQLPANDFVDGIKFGSAQTYNGDSWCPGNTRIDFTSANIERGQLFEYNRSAAIYHCPSDNSKVELPTGSDPVLRTRSYSMSSAINSQVSSFPAFRKQGEMQNQNPARLFVFIDTHEDSISDAHFAVDPNGKRWINMPSVRHGRAGNLSFADGHIERWNWLADKKFTGWYQDAEGLDGDDLQRLQSVVRK